jgi:hypothetical protein
MALWRRRSIACFAVGTALVASLTACQGELDSNAGTSSPGSGSKPGSGKGSGKVSSDIKRLRVAPLGSQSGYSREEFGTAWKDIDHNGCDQRNDVLARDMENVRKNASCKVLSGRLHDPYSGKDIDFTRSKPAEVQIDHVFPLSLAWKMGAAKWPESRREQFANDPANLLAVWGPPNRQKSDSGPAEWRPEKSYLCQYGTKFVAVANKYSLPVTSADRSALQSFVSTC